MVYQMIINLGYFFNVVVNYEFSFIIVNEMIANDFY